MAASLEFKAKNVEKAVEKASEKLNMPKKEIKYEVLSYGSSGIFGLAGAKKAKIRIQLPEEALPSASTPEISETPLIAADRIDDSEPSDAFDLDPDDAVGKDILKDGQVYSFPEDPVGMGRNVLQRIVDAITTDAQISVDEDSERIFFNVNGGNAGILIGKHGQTLDAIQSIVEKVINKRRKNRKRISKPISLGEMNAYDRRIVHIALKDNPDVLTRSRGEGPLRKLVIFPKNRNHSKR
jgi:spoIIIJ-associated protein